MRVNMGVGKKDGKWIGEVMGRRKGEENEDWENMNERTNSLNTTFLITPVRPPSPFQLPVTPFQQPCSSHSYPFNTAL